MPCYGLMRQYGRASRNVLGLLLVSRIDVAHRGGACLQRNVGKNQTTLGRLRNVQYLQNCYEFLSTIGTKGTFWAKRPSLRLVKARLTWSVFGVALGQSRLLRGR